jgi:hypothetical protein
MKPTLFALLACFAIFEGAAKDLSDIPPPTPPFVAPVPENADWVLTVKYPAKPAAAPDAPALPDLRVTEVHSMKTGDIKHDELTSADGKKRDNWYVGTLYLWAVPQGDVLAADLSGTPANPMDSSPSVSNGFPGVGWVSLNNYDKVVFWEKRPCYHYATEGLQAWVDVETLLPVAYIAGNATYVFKFNAPPTQPLVLPPSFQKTLDAAKQVSSRRAQIERKLGRK